MVAVQQRSLRLIAGLSVLAFLGANINLLLPAAGGKAQTAGSTFTLCAIADPNPADPAFCLAEVNPASAENLTIKKYPLDQAVVLSIPAKNCRSKTSDMRGGFALFVDSSDSFKVIDPQNLRGQAGVGILDQIEANAAQQVAAAADPLSADFPRVGVVGYGGRQGDQDLDPATGRVKYEADGLNPSFIKQLCSDGDAAADKFPSQTARNRWLEQADNGLFISACEYLRPVGANIATATPAEAPSIDRMQEFVRFTTEKPRGVSDFTYHWESLQNQNMLGGLNTRAKNAIVITDGLPNIPKRVPESVCQQKGYLRGSKLATDAASPNPSAKYCLDRDFRHAAKLSDDYLRQSTTFRDINVYNVLVLGTQRGFIDEDDEGELHPAQFLLEQSAWTGNGKNKFKVAKSAQDIQDFFASIMEALSSHALQRVTIAVNGNTPYNAVSPGEFDKLFTMKFINLAVGTNTVTVDAVYSDITVRKTFTVTVVEDANGAVSAPYTCTGGRDGTRTVDGDDPNDRNPNGDGVLPFPANGTQNRVPRNARARDFYDPNDFAKELRPAQRNLAQLRIQGGTGNCGSIPGGAGAAGTGLLLLALPLAVLWIRRRSE